jgi:Family of unknown function (DUF6812)
MYTINFTDVEVKISDGSMIKGKVNIRGDYNRLSDYLRYSPEQFLVIVSEEPSEDSQNVFFVNKNYIVWAGPGNPKS